MNTRDVIVTALTPGSPFNRNGLIWRSIGALSQFAGLEPAETLELLAGDLADVATVRPSQTGMGLLAALRDNVPQAANQGEEDPQVAIAGGPAYNAPPEAVDPQPDAPPGLGDVEPAGPLAFDGENVVADEPLPGMDPNAPAMD